MPYKDPGKQRAAIRAHYYRNKDAYRNSTIRRRKISKAFVNRYLGLCKCVDCGMSDIRTLDFDHVRGVKLGCVKQMAHERCPIRDLKIEIRKCEVRCANCHRIVTAERRISGCSSPQQQGPAKRSQAPSG